MTEKFEIVEIPNDDPIRKTRAFYRVSFTDLNGKLETSGWRMNIDDTVSLADTIVDDGGRNISVIKEWFSGYPLN